MRLPRECYRMKQVIETHLPHLTQTQLTGLAWWVCGATLAGSACQNAVAAALSTRGNWNNLRQYLREWLYDGSDRASPCQTELDVSLSFAPLLRWVLAWWRSGRLALAVDHTLKGDDTTAIVISVLYRGCAIPVAWRIRRANQRGSWMDPIVELLLTLAYGTRVEDAYDRRMAPGNLRALPKHLASTHHSSWSRPGRTVSVIRHGIDWLRRLLLRGRLWSRVWLLPEPWPEPKPHLEVTRHAPS